MVEKEVNLEKINEQFGNFQRDISSFIENILEEYNNDEKRRTLIYNLFPESKIAIEDSLEKQNSYENSVEFEKNRLSKDVREKAEDYVVTSDENGVKVSFTNHGLESSYQPSEVEALKELYKKLKEICDYKTSLESSYPILRNYEDAFSDCLKDKKKNSFYLWSMSWSKCVKKNKKPIEQYVKVKDLVPILRMSYFTSIENSERLLAKQKEDSKRCTERYEKLFDTMVIIFLLEIFDTYYSSNDLLSHMHLKPIPFMKAQFNYVEGPAKSKINEIFEQFCDYYAFYKGAEMVCKYHNPKSNFKNLPAHDRIQFFGQAQKLATKPFEQTKHNHIGNHILNCLGRGLINFKSLKMSEQEKLLKLHKDVTEIYQANHQVEESSSQKTY